MKPIFVLLLALCLLAVPTMALEVDCDTSLCFSPEAFPQEDLSGICITGLPESSSGTLMLGSRVVRSGDILTAQQLKSLTFQPLRTQQDTVVTVTYLPIYANKVDKAATMTISIRGKEDKAPVAEDFALETYKNLPNTATLKAEDPEGSALTYTLVRAPRRGTVVINPDGTFTYTPKKNKVGTDSFTFTATDETGNVSRQATVTINILKPSDKQTYADTAGESCRFAAEWMKNTGIFTGEQVGGAICFQPGKAVSRGEFITMLVKSLDLPVDENAQFTGFTDEIPLWLKPYLAAALRAGLTANWTGGTVFGAQEPITGAEAGVLLQNALDASIDLPSGTMTRGQVAETLYEISKMTATSTALQVFAKH